MTDLLRCIYEILSTEGNYDGEEYQFYKQVHKNMLVQKEEEYILPIPVFPNIKPNQGVSFLLHIMLSMGFFEIEIDLKMCGSI